MGDSMEINKIYVGNSLEVLKILDAESIDCVITSPPYWGLRDYGVEEQLGLEKNFHEYIDKLLLIFDEVRRILKPTGTLWVNLGDTYGGSVIGATKYQKSLCEIPSRFVIDMIDRGWILRNEIIWHKPNAMPSSVKDRFTVDFEKIFFLVKNKKYYFKQILEPNFDKYKGKRGKIIRRTKLQSAMRKEGAQDYYGKGRNKRTTWSINTRPFKGAHFAVFPPDLVRPMIEAGCPNGGIVLDPFCGSGTTCVVAKEMGRNYIGIDVNPEYVEMAKKRIGGKL